jgi:hypothetical protein
MFFAVLIAEHAAETEYTTDLVGPGTRVTSSFTPVDAEHNSELYTYVN